MLNEQNDFLGFSMSQTKHQANASASVIKDFDELRQSGERLLHNLRVPKVKVI